MSLIPSPNVLRENSGSKMRLDSLVVINSPLISEQYVITHVLANRAEVHASDDTQTRELSRIANSREHQQLGSVEDPRAQNHLLAGGHLPPSASHLVNEGMRAVGPINLLQGPVPNSTPINLGVVVRSVASRSLVAWA